MLADVRIVEGSDPMLAILKNERILVSSVENEPRVFKCPSVVQKSPTIMATAKNLKNSSFHTIEKLLISSLIVFLNIKNLFFGLIISNIRGFCN